MKLILGIAMIVAWNKLYNISLFKEIRYTIGKLHEDEFTTHKILYNANRIVYTSGIYYYYFQRQNSIMRKSYSLKRLDCIQAFEERMDFYKQKGENELYNITFQHYCYLINVHYTCCRIYLKKEKKAQQELRNKMKKNWKQFVSLHEVPIKRKISYSITCLFPSLLILRLKKNLEKFFKK